MERRYNKYIGDKQFYTKILAIMIPIMVQNGITNFVNMLDNVMVGRIGTAQMSGVSVTNQLILVYNLCIFGAVSGAGIFGAQFFGKGDTENFRNTFRFKIIFCLVMTAIGIAIFLTGGRNLVSLYLKGEGSADDISATMTAALDYIKVIVIGFVPHCISQAYASTLRETGKTVPPMTAGIIAVCVNLTFNWLLIFGNLGCPRLGVSGAAIATVISRFVELAYLIIYTYKNRADNTFIIGFFKHFSIPIALTLSIIKKGFPLMLNETLWAVGNAMITQSYSLRGLNVVAANNICSTFWTVFAVAFMAVGSAIAIVVGQQLGAGEHEEAKRSASRLVVFSFAVSVVVGILFAICAGFIPSFYNTSDTVRHIATEIMIISAICMPLDSVAQACYFVLRSGGKVLITMIFDCGFICLVSAPIVFIMAHYTGLSINWLVAAAQGSAIIKAILGIILVRKDFWVKTLDVSEVKL